MINLNNINNFILKHKDKIKILLIASFVIVGILIMAVLRCITGSDILQTKIHILDFDLWSVSHIIVCFFMTYLFPHEWFFIFIMSLLWEVFEYYCGSLNPENIKYIFGNCKLMKLSDKYDSNWWYGKKSDIIANSIGIVGALLLKKNTNY